MSRFFALCLLLLSAAAGATDMAAQGQRSRTAGLDLITFRTNVKDVVVVEAVLPAGDAMAGGGNITVPTLTGMMLDRGTRSLDKFAVAQRLDDVGAQISFGVGTQSLQVRARCLRKDLPLIIGLIAADLREPAFNSAEFSKAREQFIGSLQASTQSTATRAQEAFGRAIYPVGHPNRPHTIDEYIAAAKAVRLGDLKAFHARYYGPAHMTLVIVGDVPDDAQAQVAKAFDGWSGGQDYLHAAAPAGPAAARDSTLPLRDKPSVTMILGQATGLAYRDPDALALRVGTAILGHGFTGRLMGRVRDKEGLTYNIGATMADDSITDGDWYVTASFAPNLLQRGVASTRREIELWWRDGVTEAELADRKQGMIGGYQVSLSTTSGIATAIVAAVQRGYDLGWLDQYPQALRSLTREQVDRAIRAHISPDSLVLVEAGSIPAPAAPPAP